MYMFCMPVMIRNTGIGHFLRGGGEGTIRGQLSKAREMTYCLSKNPALKSTLSQSPRKTVINKRPEQNTVYLCILLEQKSHSFYLG